MKENNCKINQTIKMMKKKYYGFQFNVFYVRVFAGCVYSTLCPAGNMDEECTALACKCVLLRIWRTRIYYSVVYFNTVELFLCPFDRGQQI